MFRQSQCHRRLLLVRLSALYVDPFLFLSLICAQGRAIKQEKFDANDPANPARFSEGQAARDGVHEEVITIDDSPLVGLKVRR